MFNGCRNRFRHVAKCSAIEENALWYILAELLDHMSNLDNYMKEVIPPSKILKVGKWIVVVENRI